MESFWTKLEDITIEDITTSNIGAHPLPVCEPKRRRVRMRRYWHDIEDYPIYLDNDKKKD